MTQDKATPGAWENDMKPVNMGGALLCPLCQSEIIGPYSATLANNKIVQKTGCSRCAYVWKVAGGSFRTAFEANPVTFS